MKKIFLFNLLLTILVAGLNLGANAQNITTLGPRLIVNTPAGVAGLKNFTYSADPAFQGPWGGSILTKNYYHVPLVKCSDTLAENPLAAGSLTGKWVLIFRGITQFSQKAYNVQLGGAAGVIIVNNVPGADPLGMAAGTDYQNDTIPVLMVSNPDGVAMNATLQNGGVDTISLTSWGFGFDNDLAFVKGSNPQPYLGAMPLSQLSGTNGQSSQYNMYNGGFVANVGNNTGSGIVVGTDVYYTPTGGSASLVNHDTVQVGTIATIDSINGGYANRVYHPAPTANGRYDITSYIYSNDSDEDVLDDTLKTYTYVTDSIFCLGRWDPVKNMPISTGSERFAATTTDLAWGPLLFMKDGPYRAAQVQLAVNDGDTTVHDLTKNVGSTPLFVYMMNWVDQAPLDGVIQANELSIVGVGSKTFALSDSNDHMFTIQMNNADADPNTYAYMQANNYYYFAADLSNTLALDIDGSSNYFGRLSASQLTGNSVAYSAPNLDVTVSSFVGGTGDISMIPFMASNDPSTIAIRSLDGLTPAFAVYTSKMHDNAVNNVAGNGTPLFTIYPNPAVSDDIHVKLSLPATSSVVYFEIADALGRAVYRESRTNIQNADIEFPTSKLPAGQYIMAIKTDNATTGKPFTVIAR